MPVQQKLKDFLTTLPQCPFQQGSSLNAAGIDYTPLATMQAMGAEAFRVPGIFGPELAAAEGDPAHRRLLAYLGRRVTVG